MKKLAVIIATVVMFVGCQKEESNELVGTRWETTGFAALMEGIWGYRYHVYEFIDNNNVDSYWLDKNGKLVNYDEQCTYTIDPPFVIITHSADDVRTLEQKDKMTMVVTTNTSIKYLKQQ